MHMFKPVRANWQLNSCLLASVRRTYVVSCVICYVCCGKHREVNIGGGEEATFVLKNWSNIAIKIRKRNCGQKWRVVCHELEWASRWAEIRKKYVNFLLHIIGDHADDANVLGRRLHTIKKNAVALVVASKETGLEENADKTKYMFMSRDGMRDEVTI
jgi:hypothetical protein